MVLHGATYDDAYAYARELQAREGAVYIAAFDDPDIIAGQGTLGLEILADLPDVEAIVVGIGGGGLISGIATAIKGLKPDVRIIGVQASGAASMRAALDAQRLVTLPAIHTIADGIATRRAGELTFAIVRELGDEVVIVEDDEIIRTVLLLLERCKLLVEGAGAVGVAALLSGRLDLVGRRTVAVLSGGGGAGTLSCAAYAAGRPSGRVAAVAVPGGGAGCERVGRGAPPRRAAAADPAGRGGADAGNARPCALRAVTRIIARAGFRRQRGRRDL